MAISKAARAAIRVLSYMDPDVRKTYKFSRRLERLIARLYVAPEEYSIWDHKVERNGYNIPVRIFMPPEATKKALVFFHGGGWVTGNIDTYSRSCVDICNQTGQMVFAVDYRLAPEHRFPCALEDCYAVLRDLYSGSVEGLSAEHITLMGDSAGGNLAAALSLLARDRGEFLPRSQILIYPATMNHHRADSPFPSVVENGKRYFLTAKRVENYLNLYRAAPNDIYSPYFAPILAEDFSNQPRTLVITAEFCLLRDEGEEYGRRLRQGGAKVSIHRIADALHGFFTLPPSFSIVAEAYELIRQFLGEEDLLEKDAVEPPGQCGEDLPAQQQSP